MKKIIALLQIFVLLLCSTVITASADFTDTQDEAVEVISNLGLMQGYDDGTFLPENTMTRGEFAQLIANIYSIGTDDVKAWKDLFFREEQEELELVEEFEQEAVATFSDVESNHWAYAAVNTVNSLGFMTGVGNGEFAPDSIITIDQVYKVLTTMLGYQMRAVVMGGYPSGYRNVARELRITGGVSESGNALRGDVARILYNAFDVELLQLTGVGDKNNYNTIAGETFLTKIIGLTYTEGRMTDNGISTFKGASSKLKDTITLNDSLTLKIDENREYLRDFIGRQVRIYHTCDEKETVQSAVYGRLTGRDKITTFEAKDYVSFGSNKLTYRDENGKMRDIQLSVPNNMIHNKTGITSYNDAFFKGLNKATISVIETDGKNDLIIVDSYYSFYVDLVDALEEKVYSNSALVTDQNGNPEEGRKTVDLSTKDKTVVIYATDGTVTDFSAITVGSVLTISESAAYTRVYISGTKVTGYVVTESYTNDNVSYISNGTDKYVLSKDFIELKGTDPDTDTDPITAGKTYTLYIDHFGEVINAVEEAAAGLIVALLVDYASSGVFDTDVQIKYYTSEGVMETSYLAKKVRIKHENDDELPYTDLSLVVKCLEDYKGLMRLGLNADKEVNFIEFAGEQKPELGTNEENRLLRIQLNKNDPDFKKKPSKLYYHIRQGFGGVVTINESTTKIFQYQADTDCPYTQHTASGTCEEADCIYSENYPYERPPADEDAYTMASLSVFGNDKSYQIWAYTTYGDSKFAQYIVYENKVTTTELAFNSPTAILKSIHKGLNDEEEVMNIITCYNTSGTELKLYCEDDVLNSITDMYGSGADTADPENPVLEHKLEVGDVFRYTTESDGVTINLLHLMFDENAQNPHYKGTTQQGHLVGTAGYYDSTIHSMPNAFDGGWAKDGNTWDATQRRWGLFYLLSWRPGELRYTTYDLSVKDFDLETFDSSKYVLESQSSGLTRGASTVYVIEGGELTKQSLIIKDYETAGNDCDRIFRATRAGEPVFSFVIRGYTGR